MKEKVALIILTGLVLSGVIFVWRGVYEVRSAGQLCYEVNRFTGKSWCIVGRQRIPVTDRAESISIEEAFAQVPDVYQPTLLDKCVSFLRDYLAYVLAGVFLLSTALLWRKYLFASRRLKSIETSVNEKIKC